MLYYFQVWEEEEDTILSDLCKRFMNRNLFKYVEFDPAKEYRKHSELEALFKKAGIDPEYYLVFDSSSDLPYDFYRPGEEEERLPIYLLMKNEELRELSRQSDIVDAISGKRRTDHKLYFPADLLFDETTKRNIKRQIRSILEI
jgi:HD superfamily phosphohydrolase